MKMSYDKDADALTFKFKNKIIVKDQQISDEIFAGFSADGDLVEVQILDISESDKVWLTVDLAAKILKKSERTILRWIESGTLPAKKIGREFHIDPQVIDELVS